MGLFTCIGKLVGCILGFVGTIAVLLGGLMVSLGRKVESCGRYLQVWCLPRVQCGFFFITTPPHWHCRRLSDAAPALPRTPLTSPVGVDDMQNATGNNQEPCTTAGHSSVSPTVGAPRGPLSRRKPAAGNPGGKASVPVPAQLEGVPVDATRPPPPERAQGSGRATGDGGKSQAASAVINATSGVAQAPAVVGPPAATAGSSGGGGHGKSPKYQ
jgi:hypothetical protein